MKINDIYFISGTHDGKIVSNLLTHRPRLKQTFTAGDGKYDIMQKILRIARKRTMSVEDKNLVLDRLYDAAGLTSDQIEIRHFKPVVVKDSVKRDDMAICTDFRTIKNFANKLINFFSEFQVNVSIRFVDTFLRVDDKTAYTLSYFKLVDSPWYNEIAQKIKSAEWTSICAEGDNIKLDPAKKVNNHLKVYFGPAGTGKTTKACAEATACIPCSSDMDCKELLKDFKFDASGKPTFEKSVFRIAIEEGHTVVLDEINLLNTQVRQFLQSLTDGKEYVDFEGAKIKIHPDFMAIGTMNLIVNGMTFALSEPLVDRCSDIIEYELTGDSIAKALLA